MVEVPESVQRWELPPDQTGFLVTGSPFPVDESDEKVVRDIQVTLLRPRPAFSISAAIVSHQWPFVGGVALVALGLLGFAGLLGWARRMKRVPIALSV